MSPKMFDELFLVGKIFVQGFIALNMISDVELLSGLMRKRNKKSYTASNFQVLLICPMWANWPTLLTHQKKK